MDKKPKENKQSIPSSTMKILSKDTYLRQIIEVDFKNPKRFICSLCTKNQIRTNKAKNNIGGQFKWLKKHLETPSHRSFTRVEDLPNLERAIDSLKRKPKTENKDPIESEKSSYEGDKQEESDLEEQEEEKLPLSKENEVKMYLDLAQFITKNHLPFSMGNPLLSFIQEITSKYEPRLIERSHISTTTAIKIIRECIGTTLKESLFDQMRSKPFSILTDQSSDVYGGKYLALLIRYIDIAKETPVTKLISIVEIESCSTGLILYNKVKQELLIDEEYIRNNFMAICTDNESKMISTKSFTLDTEARLAIIKGAGLSNRLMKDISHLVHVRDLCHLYNLIYEDALQELPVFAIEFIKQICSYFGKGLRDNRQRDPIGIRGQKTTVCDRLC